MPPVLPVDSPGSSAATLLRLAHRQSSNETDPFQSADMVDGASDVPSRNIDPLTIGLVAGLLSLLMIIALGFIYRHHVRKQKRRAVEADARLSLPPPPPPLLGSRQKDGVSTRSKKHGRDGDEGAGKSHRKGQPSTSSYRSASRSRTRPSPPSTPSRTRAARPPPRATREPASSDDSSSSKLPDLVPPRWGSLSSESTVSSSSGTSTAASQRTDHEPVIVASLGYEHGPIVEGSAGEKK